MMPVPEGKLHRFLIRARRLALSITQHLVSRFGPHLPRRIHFDLMYLGSPPWDTGVTPPELAALIKHRPPGRAIDLGCGTGTNLVALARAGWKVTGVDFAERAVREARRKLERAGLAGDVRAGDVSVLEVVRGEYDLVLDIGCYHSLSQLERQSYRENLTSIVAPGGYFLIYTHWQFPDRADGTGISERDIDALRQILHLEDRQDSQDRWGRSTSWLRFTR